MDLRLPAAIALLAAGGFVAREADRMRDAPRAPAGIPSLLGGLTAVAAHVVWLQADRAVQERDEDRAIILLRTLTELEPQAVSAARHAAHEIGWNMLQGREDPEVRNALVREALSILGTCIERNPGSPDALRNRGRYLFLRVRTEPALADRFARRSGRTALDAALDDLRRAFDIAPDDPDVSGVLAMAALEAGRIAVAASDWAAAGAALGTAVRAYDQVLADAAAELGPESELAPDDLAALEATRQAREAAVALRDAVDSPDADRPARLDAVRRARPELRLPGR